MTIVIDIVTFLYVIVIRALVFGTRESAHELHDVLIYMWDSPLMNASL